MTAADLAPISQAIGAAGAAILLALVGWGISAFQKRTGIILTDQQKASVKGSAETAAGIIQTKLDQGLMKLADVKTDDAQVRSEAQAAIDRVPDSATALKTTPEAMAAIIVGRVDTTPKVPQTIVVAAPPAPTAALGLTLAEPGTIKLS